ncbi:hypothetical protein M8C21_017506, partial [Ambrosia artemisiifolia]
NYIKPIHPSLSHFTHKPHTLNHGEPREKKEAKRPTAATVKEIRFAEEKERESGNRERVTEEEDKAVATVVVPAVAPAFVTESFKHRNNGNNEVWVRRLTWSTKINPSLVKKSIARNPLQKPLLLCRSVPFSVDDEYVADCVVKKTLLRRQVCAKNQHGAFIYGAFIYESFESNFELGFRIKCFLVFDYACIASVGQYNNN